MPLPNTQIATPGWAAAQDPADWLVPAELAVLASWASPKRRREWLAGRLAAKRLLRDGCGLEPLSCRIGRDGVAPAVEGEHPPGLSLSLSHSGGLGAASVCGAEGWVGVDAQQVRPVHARLAARALSDRERGQLFEEFGAGAGPEGVLLWWALKEAAIKARRAAWGRSLHALEVRLTGPGRAEIGVAGEPTQLARYVLLEEGWWLARSIRPLPAGQRPAGPAATAGTGRAGSE